MLVERFEESVVMDDGITIPESLYRTMTGMYGATSKSPLTIWQLRALLRHD